MSIKYTEEKAYT